MDDIKSPVVTILQNTCAEMHNVINKNQKLIDEATMECINARAIIAECDVALKALKALEEL